MAEEVSPQQVFNREFGHLETIASYEGDDMVTIRAKAYQIMRTVDALSNYISSLLPEDQEFESSQEVVTYLQENRGLDEETGAALGEIGSISQYFLDTSYVDMDFVAEIVAYTDTYMQAIKVVFEKLQNSNSINDDVEENDEEETE